jgi:DNA polymerase-3 subunit epsilon
LAGMESVSISPAAPVLDTLLLARQLHPGQRNSLDALCKRYSVDNTRRDLHGALLDARLLAEVYLAMTGGQAALSLGQTISAPSSSDASVAQQLARDGVDLIIVRATDAELAEHNAQLDLIDKACSARALWRRSDS